MKGRGGGFGKAEAGSNVNVRTGKRIVLTQPGERFDPPAHIDHEMALSAWEDYWRDPVSSLVTDADRSLLFRWIDMVDRYWRHMDEADLEPTRTSNANGLVSNPLYKTATALAGQIATMEMKLGIGPKNRVSLGLAIVNYQAAEGRNNQPAPPTISASVEEDEDPRLMGE